MALKHSFVSVIADDPAAVTAGEVVPSNWNDNHTTDTANAFVTTDGSGDLQESSYSAAKALLSLDNVDNTSDLDKPISTATQTALDLKVDENAAITGATKTKITYDTKGLVTAGTDATTVDIADSTDKRYVTDAQLVVLGNTSGTNTGDQSASGVPNTPSGNISATNVQAAINELDTEKQPLDATLTSLSAYNTNGIIVQTAADTFAGRTITGTTNQISVVNGDGVSGNPRISIPSNADLPGAPTTTTATAGDNSTKIATTAYVDATITPDATTLVKGKVQLAGDLAGTAGSPSVATVGGKTSSAIASSVNDTIAATNSNTVSTIVKRDGSGNFSAGTITASLTGNATNVTGTVAIANGGSGQTTANAALNAFLPSQSSNAGMVLGTDGTNTSWAYPSSASADLFGAGQDGNLTISSGVTTLTDDMYYGNVTISGTASIVTAGYRLFVSGTLDLTNAPANAINANGSTGGNGAATATAGTAGAATGSVTAGGGAAGAAGGAGGTAAGTNGGNGVQGTGMSGSGGQGGAGGTGTSGAGGAIRGGGNRVLYYRQTPTADLIRGATLIAGGSSGGGGSGGGGDGTAGGGGGGGGSGGGVVAIFARTVSRGGSTASSAISAVGGVGGNGGSPAAGNRGGGGCGGGGGGGGIVIVYSNLTGSTATNALDVSGANPGTPGTGSGTGTTPATPASAGGKAGVIVVIDANTGAITTTLGAQTLQTTGVVAMANL